MSTDDNTCLPSIVPVRRRFRHMLVIVLVLAGVGYVPTLLLLNASTEVVVATATPVLALLGEVVRRTLPRRVLRASVAAA